jgi:hypothetical protein
VPSVGPFGTTDSFDVVVVRVLGLQKVEGHRIFLVDSNQAPNDLKHRLRVHELVQEHAL